MSKDSTKEPFTLRLFAIYQKRRKKGCTKHQGMYLLSSAHKL